MDVLEIIKNILLSLASVFVVIGSIIFYLKIYSNAKKIREKNRRIEEHQEKLSQVELDNIGSIVEIDLTGEKEKSKRIVE